MRRESTWEGDEADEECLCLYTECIMTLLGLLYDDFIDNEWMNQSVYVYMNCKLIYMYKGGVGRT